MTPFSNDNQWNLFDFSTKNGVFSVQERLTKQIATAMIQAVQPTGVAVVIEARLVVYDLFMII